MHLVSWEHISPCPIGGSSEPCHLYLHCRVTQWALCCELNTLTDPSFITTAQRCMSSYIRDCHRKRKTSQWDEIQNNNKIPLYLWFHDIHIWAVFITHSWFACFKCVHRTKTAFFIFARLFWALFKRCTAALFWHGCMAWRMKSTTMKSNGNGGCLARLPIFQCAQRVREKLWFRLGNQVWCADDLQYSAKR